MILYLARKILFIILVLLGVSFIAFLLTYVVPTDPARAILGLRADDQSVQNLRKNLGLDDPLYLQYSHYLYRIINGNLGYSFVTNQEVSALIIERFPATLKLSLAAFGLTVVLGIPLGCLLALYRGRYIENLLSLSLIGGASLPVFFTALLFSWIVGSVLNLLPVSGYEEGLKGIKFIILPCLALSFYPIVVIARLTRSNLINAIDKDYIRTSMAYGFSQWIIIFKYALKNTFLSVLTTLGNIFAALFSGAFFVEYIFSWPGIGLLAVDSVMRYDFPIIQGIVLFTSSVFIAVTTVVDILYSYLDPRIRFCK